jgi:hypothetical protein
VLLDDDRLDLGARVKCGFVRQADRPLDLIPTVRTLIRADHRELDVRGEEPSVVTAGQQRVRVLPKVSRARSGDIFALLEAIERRNTTTQRWPGRTNLSPRGRSSQAVPGLESAFQAAMSSARVGSPGGDSSVEDQQRRGRCRRPCDGGCGIGSPH